MTTPALPGGVAATCECEPCLKWPERACPTESCFRRIGDTKLDDHMTCSIWRRTAAPSTPHAHGGPGMTLKEIADAESPARDSDADGTLSVREPASSGSEHAGRSRYADQRTENDDTVTLPKPSLGPGESRSRDGGERPALSPRVLPGEPACRCGSGLHPRRCEVHPERYAQHCAEISAETAAEDAGTTAPKAPPVPRCAIYDAPCVSPEVCLDTRACCGGDVIEKTVAPAPKAPPKEPGATPHRGARPAREVVHEYLLSVGTPCHHLSNGGHPYVIASCEAFAQAIERDRLDSRGAPRGEARTREDAVIFHVERLTAERDAAEASRGALEAEVGMLRAERDRYREALAKGAALLRVAREGRHAWNCVCVTCEDSAAFVHDVEAGTIGASTGTTAAEPLPSPGRVLADDDALALEVGNAAYPPTTITDKTNAIARGRAILRIVERHLGGSR